MDLPFSVSSLFISVYVCLSSFSGPVYSENRCVGSAQIGTRSSSSNVHIWSTVKSVTILWEQDVMLFHVFMKRHIVRVYWFGKQQNLRTNNIVHVLLIIDLQQQTTICTNFKSNQSSTKPEGGIFADLFRHFRVRNFACLRSVPELGLI
jgi:hypothetical protein